MTAIRLVRSIGLWLWDHWYVPAVMLAFVIGVLWRKQKSPGDLLTTLRHELDVINAGRDARNSQEIYGAERAAELVQASYRERMLILTQEQEQKSRELAQDPIALARYLERVSRTTP